MEKLWEFITRTIRRETTVNLGVVQYSPEGMELSLDIRYPKNGSAKEVEEQVRKAAQKYQLEVLECETTPMLYMPIESELIQKLMHVYHEITGREEQPWRLEEVQMPKHFRTWWHLDRRFQEIRRRFTSRMNASR